MMSGATERQIAEVAKAGEPDRYAAALLAPAAAQGALVALAAVAAEIARIPWQTSEPTLAEIRLQWWHDALAAGMTGALSGQPALDRLTGALRQWGISATPLLGAIASCRAGGGADGSGAGGDAGPDGPLMATEGALFEVALALLGGGEGDVSRATLGHAATAYGLARGLAEPSRGLCDVAGGSDRREELAARARLSVAAARQDLHRLRRPLLTAFLPLALVEPYLSAVSSPDAAAAHGADAVVPLRRFWRIGLAFARGRV
ncbi:MAG: squalene/phytoene synthase family protein [Hyphomicrobiaceae bacterium]